MERGVVDGSRHGGTDLERQDLKIYQYVARSDIISKEYPLVLALPRNEGISFYKERSQFQFSDIFSNFFIGLSSKTFCGYSFQKFSHSSRLYI